MKNERQILGFLDDNYCKNKTKENSRCKQDVIGPTLDEANLLLKNIGKKLGFDYVPRQDSGEV